MTAINQKLLVFNIQKYSLHDGEGIRTTVFLKGCPLRCRWCCNPESQKEEREIIFRKTRCLGEKVCGLCKDAFPKGGISFNKEGIPVIDYDVCNTCYEKSDVCPSKALEIEGRWMSTDEIIQNVLKDEVFYKKGGLTLSGGEPLNQRSVVSLLKKAKEERINTAVETCGYVPTKKLLEAAEYLDEIFFDVKSVDDNKHQEYTSKSNALILENIKALKEHFPDKKIHVRTPVIPGFNDKEEELERIKEYLDSIDIKDWEKLPYHTYGVGKYEMLGREYKL